MSALALTSPLRLVVGLGNPGGEYAGTRHNVGFMLVDRLAQRAGASFQVERRWKAEWTRAGELYLCKPMTYMNLSGEAVRLMGDFYKAAPAEMLVVVDDLALPLGKLRLRAGGSAGGHNGLKSIFQHLGTQEVPRLRLGIDASEPGATVDHVLGRFRKAELPLLEDSLIQAEQAISTMQSRGLAAAMNAFN